MQVECLDFAVENRRRLHATFLSRLAKMSWIAMTVSDGLRTVLCGRMMLEVRRLAAELRALAVESAVR